MISRKIILSLITSLSLSSRLAGMIPYDLSQDYHKLVTKTDLRTSSLYRKFVLQHIGSHYRILRLSYDVFVITPLAWKLYFTLDRPK